MRGGEREQTARESIALHHGEHGAQEGPVRDEEVERQRAAGETAGECDDRDANVVHDDERAHERPVTLGDVRPEASLG